MYKYEFDCKDGLLEDILEKKANYVNCHLKEQFDDDDFFKIYRIEVSFEIDNEGYIFPNSRFVTRNGLKWKYTTFTEDGECHHSMYCIDNSEYSFDWWT